MKRSHDFLDVHIQKIFKRYEVNTVLDVGANIGQYGEFLRKNGYKGRIISFEPIGETYLKLKEISKNDSNWTVFNYALGDTEESKKMQVAGKVGKTDFSSFLIPNESAYNDFSISSKESQTEISIKILDKIIEELKLQKNARIHLKMDTQGYDLNVFRGSTKTLDMVVSMQSEISFMPIYDGMPNFLESLECFKEKGFKISGIYPVSRNKDKLHLIESDAVLVKG